MPAKKQFRMHILLDEPLKKLLNHAAHDSWMSVGQYIRETVALFKGVPYDTAADWVMIGQEIGIQGFENLKEMADRRGITVKEFCEKFGKPASSDESVGIKDADQLSLFDQPVSDDHAHASPEAEGGP